MSKQREDDEACRDALQLIAALHVCTLCTWDGERPHAVSLLYAHDGFDLYWFSALSARHSQHVDGSPHALVGATIAADHEDFTDIRGIQMTGVAQRLRDDAERSAGLALLAGRYSFLLRLSALPSKLAEALGKAGIYRLSAEEVTFIDNTKGFGHKTTFRPRRQANGFS